MLHPVLSKDSTKNLMIKSCIFHIFVYVLKLTETLNFINKSHISHAHIIYKKTWEHINILQCIGHNRNYGANFAENKEKKQFFSFYNIFCNTEYLYNLNKYVLYNHNNKTEVIVILINDIKYNSG